MVEFTLTLNMHRKSSYSTTPLLYPRAFTHKLQAIQFLLVIFPLAQQCTVSEIKYKTFILMHGERRQKRKKNNKQRVLQKYYAKYKKVGVLPLYEIQGLTF